MATRVFVSSQEDFVSHHQMHEEEYRQKFSDSNIITPKKQIPYLTNVAASARRVSEDDV
jgi:hypothetical protein